MEKRIYQAITFISLAIIIIIALPDSVTSQVLGQFSASKSQVIIIIPPEKQPPAPRTQVRPPSDRTEVPPKINYEPVLGVTRALLNDYERQRKIYQEVADLETDARRKAQYGTSSYQMLYDQAVRKYQELYLDPINEYFLMQQELIMLFNGPNR